MEINFTQSYYDLLLSFSSHSDIKIKHHNPYKAFCNIKFNPQVSNVLMISVNTFCYHLIQHLAKVQSGVKYLYNLKNYKAKQNVFRDKQIETVELQIRCKR